MSAETWTIFCIFEGEESSFSVDIPKDRTVDHLKDEIKKKRPQTLHDVDAALLTLYKIDIPDSEAAKISEQLTALDLSSKTPMKATLKLNKCYLTAPPDDTIHILVQVPPPKLVSTPENGPKPLLDITPPKADIHLRVKEYEAILDPILQAFLKDDVQLPLWEPTCASDAFRSHVANLKIPTISRSSKSPSLLLHNLGQVSHDPQLAGRVNKLFRAGSQRRFLCNTSGSGKTRLLLEGLWRNWGLYFTARTQPEGVGSSDLENALLNLERFGRLKQITDENRATMLPANREEASRRFLLILYVRLFVFRVFLRCAFAVHGKILEKHKGRWLLIQVAPGTLLGVPDIFSALARRVGRASVDYLLEAIQCQLDAIQHFLGSKRDLFCVLDEAQIPTNMFSDCFLSDTEPVEPRPILREIILVWGQVIPKLIVSGTGVSMQEVETVLGSAVSKEPGVEPETVTDVGAFDNEEDQRAYLERYLPPGYLDQDCGKELASRVGYWLHGRHRFTATFLSRLIRSNFQSPHQVLNDFVYGMTGFQPSDWKGDCPLIPKLEQPRGFDFSKLKKDEALHRQVAGLVFDYIFNGKPRDMGGPQLEKLVEYGFARFGNLKAIVADEPLALLAAMDYFTTNTAWSLPYFLKNGISTSNESARGLAFEQLSAYLIGLAFKSPTTLSTVFQFVGANELKDQVAELVAVHKSDGELVCDLVDISSNMRPTYILGRSPRTEAETLSWLQDPERAVFCFPASTIGPDLILFLRLPDHKLIRVFIQFKLINRSTIGRIETEDAFRTTDPNLFVSVKSSSTRQPRDHLRNPGLTENLKSALKDLASPKAGEFGVLRVLAVFPAMPDIPTLEDMVEADSSKHPAATLNMESLATNSSEEEIFESLKQNLVEAAIRRRKRRSEDDQVARIKRQKTEHHVAAE